MNAGEIHNKEDSDMLRFLSKFDLTQKERMKFLANRSGLIKMARNSAIKIKPSPMPTPNLVM